MAMCRSLIINGCKVILVAAAIIHMQMAKTILVVLSTKWVMMLLNCLFFNSYMYSSYCFQYSFYPSNFANAKVVTLNF